MSRLIAFLNWLIAKLPDASPLQRGLVNRVAQTFGGVKSQIDPTLQGTPARRLLHPEVSVLDFGADPTGIADSSPAFRDAINSFSGSGETKAGTVLVPQGRYRISSPVRIKKSVWIRGVQAAGFYQTCVILPDVGICPFVVERYNTPEGTTDSAGGDHTMISSLLIYPQVKATPWLHCETVSVGTVRRTGTGLLDDWRRHYVCTQAGITAATGNGPRSYGNDKLLNYDGQTHAFTREDYVAGVMSGAQGIIIADSGTQLRITSVRGSFIDNEVITDPDGGQALANGADVPATGDELDGSARWSYLGGAHGIQIRAFGVTVRDVVVINASGNGIHVMAQEPETPNAIANANNWFMDNVACYACSGHGFFVQGSDTNDGVFRRGIFSGAGDATSDQNFSGTAYGICDLTLPGSSYSQVHFEANGLGPVYCHNAGQGSIFLGCSLEGDGGGPCVGIGNGFVVGGALAGAYWYVGAPTWGPSPFIRIPASGGSGAVNLNNRITGYTAPARQAGIAVPVPHGVQKFCNGNIYVAVQPGLGVTDATGSGPTGTANGQRDGSVIWDFVHAFVGHGSMTLGSVDPIYPSFYVHQGTFDTGTGLASYYREVESGPVKFAAQHQYGISGSSADNNGIGLIHALNKSIITEWPTKLPAGRAFFEKLWIGGCQLFFGTDLPASGSFNPGDRLFYKGAAVVAGGREGKICTEGGTIGTYSGGRTATATGNQVITLSGAAMIPYIDQHEFKVGDVISIAGGPQTRVIDSSDDGLTLTVDVLVPAGTGLSLAFVAPTFKDFGSIAN